LLFPGLICTIVTCSAKLECLQRRRRTLPLLDRLHPVGQRLPHPAERSCLLL